MSEQQSATEWFESRAEQLGTHDPTCWKRHPDCAYWQGRRDADVTEQQSATYEPVPLMAEGKWREWKILGCVRDKRGVLRLILEDFDGTQRQVMGIEAHNWEPLGAVVGKDWP